MPILVEALIELFEIILVIIGAWLMLVIVFHILTLLNKISIYLFDFDFNRKTHPKQDEE